MKLSIVVPVYNEAKTIRSILEVVQAAPLPPEFESREIVVVNDCSTDGTAGELDAIADTTIRVFHHDVNKGKGAALRTGFQNVTGDVVVIQDADLEYDPNEYGKLLAPIVEGKADVVYGSRFAGGESHRILYYWHSLGNKALTWISNMLSDLNLTDMETCYKVFRREVLEQIAVEENRFGFEPEVTAKVAHLSRTKGVRIYEVGISYYGRTYEEGKKIGLKDAFRALWCVLKFNTTGLAQFIRYGFMGLIVALSQFLTIVGMVELSGIRTLAFENIANAVSIEVSIVVGFLLHSRITWRHRYSGFRELAGKIALFHLVTLASFLVRVGLFYLLSLSGIDYRVNSALGILLAVILNFIGYRRLVFREAKAHG